MVTDMCYHSVDYNRQKGFDMIDNFGNALRNIRKKKKLTLEEMAELLGTTKQALSRYERGERTPKITVASQFADKLGVDLQILVGENGDMKMNLGLFGEDEAPKTEEARILSRGIDKLSPEERAQALAVVKAMFAQHPEIFKD